MTCNNCGDWGLKTATADLPVKIRLNSTAIVRNFPVLQCYEHLIEDPVMMELASPAADINPFKQL